MEPEGSLSHFKCPPPVPNLSQIDPVLAPAIPLVEDPSQQQSTTVFKIEDYRRVVIADHN
jgi:hypothetical protein